MPPKQQNKIGGKRRQNNAPKKVGVQNITKGDIRRLARRGGIKRLSSDVYGEVQDVIQGFLERIIRDTLTFTEHARRKTVLAMDVVQALKRSGRHFLGYI
ncbi:Histone-fold [Pseudocohnilembus persalinus]|uniref:Histone H4 n=1 Tax=Pseudocohnilembus persalinus TaxID=266149 RepID=A0A0V0QT03_PSEPJ|nr:Histone-fold [Pseudocohnilembus persalinus]|eukprot:KRX05335.1 Histone-fold [Pseudocohnilembus persalinus]